jgi:hypothetical protein
MGKNKPKQPDFEWADAEIAQMGGLENCRILGPLGSETPGYYLDGRLIGLILEDEAQYKALVKRLIQAGVQRVR